jgi:hypothetical protein
MEVDQSSLAPSLGGVIILIHDHNQNWPVACIDGLVYVNRT